MINQNREDSMAFGDFGDPATITAIVIGVIVVIGIVIFAMRTRITLTKKPKNRKINSDSHVEIDPLTGVTPFKISKSVQSGDASQAKDELRILDLEREILSDALRHLYEAHAEGKINEQEREKLASSYKARMMAVKESMAKDETIVALHELEDMQEDLMKLFSSRFGELTSKVDELRTRINVKPIREVKVQMPEPQAELPPELDTEEEETETESESEDTEEKQKKKKKSASEKPATPKTEAEKRIDEIRSEVEKVLDKLGNMEIET
jgi:hypothetical protein